MSDIRFDPSRRRTWLDRLLRRHPMRSKPAPLPDWCIEEMRLWEQCQTCGITRDVDPGLGIVERTTYRRDDEGVWQVTGSVLYAQPKETP